MNRFNWYGGCLSLSRIAPKLFTVTVILGDERTTSTTRFFPGRRVPTLELPSHTADQAQSAAENDELQQIIERAAHLLPCQGPITAFVHHNTLHAFEDLDFDAGVQSGGRIYGCEAYLSEDRYREELRRGRIRAEDLNDVLLQDLGDEADRLVSTFCTRFSLRLSMLQFELSAGSIEELHWIIAESNALERVNGQTSSQHRYRLLKDARDAIERTAQDDQSNTTVHQVLQDCDSSRSFESWNDRKWEAFALKFLWSVCRRGIHSANSITHADHRAKPSVRHRDLLLRSGSTDTDQDVHEVLIPFCAAFLDQGFCGWELPARQAGFFHAFLQQHAETMALTPWHRLIRQECRRLLNSGTTPLESIRHTLIELSVKECDRKDFIVQSLLALRGWAGMLWQMETNSEWTAHPAPRGTLVEFLAVRLLLDKIVVQRVANTIHGTPIPVCDLAERLVEDDEQPSDAHPDLMAYQIFQLAQLLGWKPQDLDCLGPQQWKTLCGEIHAFSSMERRRIFQLAYERRYRQETLNAVAAHNRRQSAEQESLEAEMPTFQLATCIDDREESFRRHIEEACPAAETFGIAGFYGTAMYYRGLGDAHFKPLCPVSIKPTHKVVEEPVYSQAELERRKSVARKTIGQLRRRTHLGSRSLIGGILTGLSGSLAAFPLVSRVLFPRATSRLRSWFTRIVTTPATELCIEHVHDDSQDAGGFTLDEMTDIVESVLRSSGLAARWSRLVIILGHGSASLNNPHESAYNCGACAGSQGGPNARAFALMANDHRVRSRLAEQGLQIPETTVFVGGYHDTTNESVTFSDLDRLPVSHRKCFEEALEVINEARRRNAHERCRRFESASLSLTTHEALRHVEDRPEDLSQARPEYNHATNALCFVGHRRWSRGLFLDRRAFLTSYDASLDDDQGTILEGLLRAAIPVCAGINLEYYFSTVDVEGYGCGSKLPHNITSMLGVMSGAASDLRPGLSEQMVEIHEPMRMLFVIETSPQTMRRIIENNEAIAKLVKGRWVQLAILDTKTNELQVYSDDDFRQFTPSSERLAEVATSSEWYSGRRDNLPFASVLQTAILQTPIPQKSAGSSEASV